MPPDTRGKTVDIKSIIKETITELLSDDNFISRVADKVKKNRGLEEIEQKLNECVEVDALKKQNMQLSQHIDKAEQYSRRNNLRIFGIPEAEGEKEKELETTVIVSSCQIFRI